MDIATLIFMVLINFFISWLLIKSCMLIKKYICEYKTILKLKIFYQFILVMFALLYIVAEILYFNGKNCSLIANILGILTILIFVVPWIKNKGENI